MRSAGLAEVKQALSRFVDQAQSEGIVIMRHGRPAAIITGVEGADWEEVMYLADPAFMKLHRARMVSTSPRTSHADFRKELEGTKPKRRGR